MEKSDNWNSEEKRLERRERLNSLKQKDGLKKPLQQKSKFARVWMPIIAVVVVVSIGVWAAIQFALPQKLFPPMNISGKNVTSAEFSYYYYNVLSNLQIDRTTEAGQKALDEMCTVEGYTTLTWREYAYEITALQIVDTYINSDLAVKENITLTAEQTEEIDAVFTNIVDQMGSKVEADKYLMDLFGKDVTIKSLRPVFERVKLAQIYAAKVMEDMDISEAEANVLYEQNKNSYDAVTFRLQGFDVTTATDATDEQIEAETEKVRLEAEAFLQKATGSEVFKQLAEEKKIADELAVYNALTTEEKVEADAEKTADDKAEQEYRATMTAEERAAEDAAQANTDYTVINSMAKADVDNASEDLGDWLFDSARVNGDKKVFEMGSGFYAIYFETRNTTFNLPSARHILISPNEAKDVPSGDIFTAEEWTAARIKANEILALCTSEEEFIGLVEENSSDTGSVSNDGLYEDIGFGEMMPTFNDWVFDPARRPGDTGIVRTTYGFHIMWFVGMKTTTALGRNLDTIKAQITQENFEKLMVELRKLDEYKYEIKPFGVRLTDLG